jgi:hypothetical protein
MRDGLKERIRALQALLNATQTRAAFLKEEMKLAGADFGEVLSLESGPIQNCHTLGPTVRGLSN